MNVALFGGTFDPFHKGHLAAAHAAANQFRLREVHFVLAGVAPHKTAIPVAPFAHRYAMLSLGLAGDRHFIPSLLESEESSGHKGPHYSVNTVRQFRKKLAPSDRLFFIVGADSFQQLHSWRDPEALLRMAEFIVVSRPGYSLEDIGAGLPESLRPSRQVLAASRELHARGSLLLPGDIVLHFLEDVHVNISATQVREAAEKRVKLQRYVPAEIAEYIQKTGLYQSARTAGLSEKKVAPKHSDKVIQFKKK